MSHPTPSTSAGPEAVDLRTPGPNSLRERKKLKTMRHIQEVALDLFEEHGYTDVTIERIAAEAEVSPSSIYRYFGTKEQLVLYDEYDPLLLQMLAEDFPEADPIEAVRQIIARLVHEFLPRDERLIRRRMRFALGEPSVRAGMSAQVEEVDVLIREAIARRTDRRPDDLELKVVSRALVAGFLACLEHWHERDYADPLDELLEHTFEVMTSGLKLT